MKEKLLLLHGAIGSKSQLVTLQNFLQDSFDIISIDFSGHGGRPLPKLFSMDLFVKDILDCLKENNIASANIFGYSMGGYAALCLAVRQPERVKKIFTLATKFDWTEESALRESKMLNPDKIREKVPHFSTELEKRHAPQDWKLVLSKTADMMLALGKNPALNKNEFEKIKCPVLISRGSEDTLVSAAETEAVHKMIKGSQLMTFPGIPHPIEKIPVEVIGKEIKTFFRS